MKKRKPNFIKLGILLFGVSIFLWNCFPEETNFKGNKLDYNLEKINYSKLIKDNEIQNKLYLIEGRFSNKKKSISTSSKTTQVADGVIILTDEINKITFGETITWTFQIETPALETSDFENFLVKKYNDVFSYFLISYKLTETKTEIGYEKVTSYKILEKYLTLDNINLASKDALDWAPIDDAGGVASGCDGVLVWDYSPCEAGNSNYHGPSCQHSGAPHVNNDCNWLCKGTPILYLDFSHCSNYASPSGPSNGTDNNSTDSDNNQMGGIGGSNTTGDSTITSPVEPEDPRCEPGSGKTMVNEVCVCLPSTKKVEDKYGNCNCPEDKLENKAGICVENPCKHIKLQIQNPRYTDQANELKTKTGLKKETGYKQNKDGSQVSLTETNGGHSLAIPIDNNTVGYMHTHLNDFNVGDTNGDGIDDKIEPIRMFSPADIIKFLQMIKNSKYNGVPTHLVYATMISSSSNYTLRFTGDIDFSITHLKTANDYKTEYKKYFEEDYKNNNERALLNFLKDIIKVDGVNLYRIRDNGDIEKKALNDNKKVDTNDCE